MKIQYIRFVLILVGLLSFTGAKAHHFAYGGIYYYIVSDEHKHVGVTFKDELTDYGIYWGTVNIPSTVPYGREIYNVVAISEYGFKHCSGLDFINIPDGVTYIGYEAFESSGLRSVNIPDGVTSIGKSAFADCTRLSSITLPAGITAIESRTFLSCEKLTSVTIPDKVTSIGEAAFANCSKLASVTLPAGMTTIGKGTFTNCNNMTFITIPDKVATIGERAFWSCKNLTSITLPNSVNALGSYAFYDSGLTSITLSDGLTAIEAGSFIYCEELASIIIPDKVISIGSSAFANCTSLTSVTVGRSVSWIDDGAFGYCTKLKEVHSLNPRPAALINNPFVGVDTSKLILYVPKGSKQAYEQSLWRDFNIVEEETTGINTRLSDKIVVNGTGHGLDIETKEPVFIAIYTISGQLLWHETVDGTKQIPLDKGVYVVKVGNRSSKVAVG